VSFPYMLAHVSLFEISPVFTPSDFPNKWYQSQWFTLQVVSELMVCGLGEYSLTLYWKSSWQKFRGSVSHLSV